MGTRTNFPVQNFRGAFAHSGWLYKRNVFCDTSNLESNYAMLFEETARKKLSLQPSDWGRFNLQIQPERDSTLRLQRSSSDTKITWKTLFTSRINLLCYHLLFWSSLLWRISLIRSPNAWTSERLQQPWLWNVDDSKRSWGNKLRHACEIHKE